MNGTRVVAFASLLMALTPWVPIQERAVITDLQPVPGFFSSTRYSFDYLSRVRRILFKDQGEDSNRTLFRMVALPSSAPEWLVSVEQEPEGYRAVSRALAKPLPIDAPSQAQSEDIKVKVQSRSLDEELARRIQALCWGALETLTYTEEKVVQLDGDDYFFFAAKEDEWGYWKWRAGQTTSHALAKGLGGHLKGMTDSLLRYAEGKAEGRNNAERHVSLTNAIESAEAAVRAARR